MELEIIPLSPESGPEFCAFFDHLDYSYKPDWRGCYCQFYHSTCDEAGWQARSPGQNRADALARIARGEMRGYLAYADGECVGWCNANALAALPRFAGSPELAQFDDKTGVVICFVIRPDFRGRGAARQLIRAAVEGFRREGFARVLGLPFEWKEHPELQYHGTRAMFADAGFSRVNTDAQRPLMVLDLSEEKS
ncbi:MAG TPA: GNAT family N-acetyltransferase [Anaerolineaceae bacterium]|nr:GNAT family N-acetyltransferase [Anaerolineaceae bacterium]